MSYRTRRSHGALGLLAVAILGLAACTADGPATTSATPAAPPSSDPNAVELRIDPATMPDLTAQPATAEAGTWKIAGAPQFDEALRSAVSDAADDGTVESWPVGVSSDLVGFRVRASDDDSATSTDTFWYSLRQGRVIGDEELLPEAGDDGGVSFTSTGEPYLESVVDGTVVARRGDPGQLTELGRQARRAALFPLNPVVGAEVDCSLERCIALTFDDGPSEFTYPLLQTLAANHAAATFFIRGSSTPGAEDVLLTTSTAGHQIGNHSQNHLRLSQQDRATVDQEIASTAAALEGVPRNGSALFRPPYGDSDADVLAAAKAQGYAVIMWNLDPLDYKTTDAQTIAARVLASAGRGSVVLSHDTLPGTEEAYRTIVPELTAAGYRLVTVDQLLGPSQPGQLRGGY